MLPPLGISGRARPAKRNQAVAADVERDPEAVARTVDKAAAQQLAGRKGDRVHKEIDRAEALADLGKGGVDGCVAGYIAFDDKVAVDTRRQRLDALLEDFTGIAQADLGTFPLQSLRDAPGD